MSNQYTNNELEEALRAIASTTAKCEKVRPKLKQGTAQHTLLVRRIEAFRIASELIKREINMAQEIEEKLARSLTAETTDLLPFLPYLLQDLWELGSSPKDMIKLMKKHMTISKDTRILDLACGKGAVSVRVAESLGVNVYGFDLFPEFIEYAKQKAEEFNVGSLCRFVCGDANEAVKTEKDYDCVIFGAAGNILGKPDETLKKLAKTVKAGGYILIDEAYLRDDASNKDIKYDYDYLTHEGWMALFKDNGLTLLDELPTHEEYDFDSETKAIVLRAEELSVRHPEKREMFEEYVNSQLNECEDLENNVMGVTWMLQTSKNNGEQ